MTAVHDKLHARIRAKLTEEVIARAEQIAAKAAAADTTTPAPFKP